MIIPSPFLGLGVLTVNGGTVDDLYMSFKGASGSDATLKFGYSNIIRSIVGFSGGGSIYYKPRPFKWIIAAPVGLDDNMCACLGIKIHQRSTSGLAGTINTNITPDAWNTLSNSGARDRYIKLAFSGTSGQYSAAQYDYSLAFYDGTHTPAQQLDSTGSAGFGLQVQVGFDGGPFPLDGDY